MTEVLEKLLRKNIILNHKSSGMAQQLAMWPTGLTLCIVLGDKLLTRKGRLCLPTQTSNLKLSNHSFKVPIRFASLIIQWSPTGRTLKEVSQVTHYCQRLEFSLNVKV